jgi:shikimate dehydrogenase
MNQSKFGLIGRNISYSFSQAYFTEKFKILGRKDLSYHNYDIQDLKTELIDVLSDPDLKGLNVTIPYKKEIIPFLDGLGPIASEIGAVNTIKIQNGKKIGYNTDAFGFRDSLKTIISPKKPESFNLWYGWSRTGGGICFRELKNSLCICLKKGRACCFVLCFYFKKGFWRCFDYY